LMKKNLYALILSLCLLLTAFPVCAEEAAEVDLTLDGYSEMGGMLSVTDAYETFETGAYGFSAMPRQTIGEVLENNGVVSVEPVLEGDECEGWMEVAVCTTVDEDGFEWQEYSLLLDQMYTTEELLALTVPDSSVMYVAKWVGIPAEDYYGPYYEAAAMPSITLLSSEGVILMNSDEGQYETTMSAVNVEPGQTFGEALELDNIAAMTAEGKMFTGWTVYEYNIEAMETSETCVDEEGVLCFEVFEDNYMVLREYSVCQQLISEDGVEYTYISTKELAEVVCEAADHIVIANWMTAEEYLTFVKERADAITLSLEQDALTQTDMNLKSEELCALWDRARNLLLDEAIKTLPEAETKNLTVRQSVWEADMKVAVEAAGKEFEGGSMHALVVNSEAARLTEECVYELYKLLK